MGIIIYAINQLNCVKFLNHDLFHFFITNSHRKHLLLLLGLPVLPPLASLLDLGPTGVRLKY